MAEKIEKHSTGIPKIDHVLAEILKRPEKRPKMARFEDDFPECKIEGPTSASPTVYVVGAGWEILRYATAIIAAGAKVVAYDMVPEKVGLGQVGLTRKDEYFELLHVRKVAYLMPDFTQEQLGRLPGVLTKIATNRDYQDLVEKRNIVNDILSQVQELPEKYKQYDKLPQEQKLSKRELVEVKRSVLEILKEDGALEIIPQEVTIDMVHSWLSANRPVFMNTGEQVNLNNMGLDHLSGKPGFVKEFLLSHPDTVEVIRMIKEKQRKILDQGKKAPGTTLPSVALIGGGLSALGSANDLLEKVDPELLEVVWIRPEEKIASDNRPREAPGEIKFELIPGYVSGVKQSKNGRIESVDIFDEESKAKSTLRCDLLVHTWDGDVHAPESSTRARDLITRRLDQEKPSNGLVRAEWICGEKAYLQARKRIDETLSLSFEDDDVLKKQIQELVNRQESEEVTIVVHAHKNSTVDLLMTFAASLGYRGKCFQVKLFATPIDGRSLKLREELDKKKKKCTWHDVRGRVEGGTVSDQEKFSLRVRDKNGEEVPNVPAVDAIINCAGKNIKTPLVNAMIEKGYIIHDDEKLTAAHSKLFGSSPFHFVPKTKPASIVKIFPITLRGPIRPPGWEDTFNSTREMLGQQ